MAGDKSIEKDERYLLKDSWLHYVILYFRRILDNMLSWGKTSD